jgi:hypothetical protein
MDRRLRKLPKRGSKGGKPPFSERAESRAHGRIEAAQKIDKACGHPKEGNAQLQQEVPIFSSI